MGRVTGRRFLCDSKGLVQVDKEVLGIQDGWQAQIIRKVTLPS